MKFIKTLFVYIMVISLCGCSSNTASNTTKYNHNNLTFTISNDYNVTENTFGLIVDTDDWKLTLGTGNLISTATDTLNAWEGYLSIAKWQYSNVKSTTYIGQEAFQFVDSSSGLNIHTYLKSPENPEYIHISIYNKKGDHEKLLENKDIQNIINSCEVK